MATCKAISKSTGKPCTWPAMEKSGLCCKHDPANKKNRIKAASLRSNLKKTKRKYLKKHKIMRAAKKAPLVRSALIPHVDEGSEFNAFVRLVARIVRALDS